MDAILLTDAGLFGSDAPGLVQKPATYQTEQGLVMTSEVYSKSEYCDDSGNPIDGFTLSIKGEAVESIGAIRGDPDIKEVREIDLSLTSTDRIDFAQLTGIESLESVRFYKCTLPEGEQGLDLLPPIRSVSFDACRGALELKALWPQRSKLKTLDIINTHVRNIEDVKAFTELEFLRFWDRLSYTDSHPACDSVDLPDVMINLEWLSNMTVLRGLALQGRLSNVPALVALKSLTYVSLESTDISAVQGLWLGVMLPHCRFYFPWTERSICNPLVPFLSVFFWTFGPIIRMWHASGERRSM